MVTLLARMANEFLDGKEPLKHRYIAVEGPIGVGKTSLGEMLCTRLDAVKVLEDVENPFL